MTDQQIVQEIRNSNEEAFKELVEKKQKMIINVCYSFVHDKEDPMDIAQKVFIKACNSIHKFHEKPKTISKYKKTSINQFF